MEHAPATDRTPVPVDLAADIAPAGACPFPHGALPAAMTPGCPVPHGATARAGIERSPADLWVRHLLRVQERPVHVSEAAANSAFQKSMLISATRCTLTYVVFPLALPFLGIAKGVGFAVGLVIGALAIVCDVFTIRRFFAADHKYRWYFSAIALGIIGLLAVLLVEDFIAIVT